MPEYFPRLSTTTAKWRDDSHNPSIQFSEEPTAQFVLFTNARIFDGKTNKLTDLYEVLIHKNIIRKIGPLVPVPQDVKLVKVDCDGKTLMPGLIDMHAHICLQEGGMMENAAEYDAMAMGAMCAADLQDYLQQGFTTIRDAGGNCLSIHKAIQRGRLVGPRMFPSGAFLCQTGGYADTAGCCSAPLGGPAAGDASSSSSSSHYNYLQQLHAGFSSICNGRDEVLKACRTNLRDGATQIKIMASGSVSSDTHDPMHTAQFTLDEMKAAVEVAADYGTYVMAHAYHDKAIHRCIDAGVRCIEHGYLMTEATMERLVQEDVALSIQATMSLEAFADINALAAMKDQQKIKAAMVCAGAKNMMDLVHKHNPIVVAGGDMFGKGYQDRQADNIIHMVTMGGFSHLEALKAATSNAAKVLSWSGPMNPYAAAKLGVIEEGAYADVLVVNGNPLEDIYALKRNNIDVVLKDGKCHKFKLKDGSLQVVTFRVGQH